MRVPSGDEVSEQGGDIELLRPMGSVASQLSSNTDSRRGALQRTVSSLLKTHHPLEALVLQDTKDKMIPQYFDPLPSLPFTPFLRIQQWRIHIPYRHEDEELKRERTSKNEELDSQLWNKGRAFMEKRWWRERGDLTDYVNRRVKGVVRRRMTRPVLVTSGEEGWGLGDLRVVWEGKEEEEEKEEEGVW